MTTAPSPSTVLVTGATGFVGSALCHRLQSSGRAVIACNRSAVVGPWTEQRVWDLAHPLPAGLLDGVDTVFHLAGRAHALADSPEQVGLYDALNHEATRRLATAAAKAAVRSFIFVSSSKAAPPSTALTLSNAYAASKWQGEQAVLTVADRMHVAIARPTLVYGPGVKGNLLQLLRAIDRNRMPALPRVANRRSLVGVHDLVITLELMAHDDRAAGRTLSVTDGEVYSTHRILDALSRALGKGPARQSRLPVAAFKGLSRVGDLLQGMSGRPMPMSSDVYDKLLGSSEHSRGELTSLLGLSPSETLESSAASIVRHYRGSRAE